MNKTMVNEILDTLSELSSKERQENDWVNGISRVSDRRNLVG